MRDYAPYVTPELEEYGCLRELTLGKGGKSWGADDIAMSSQSGCNPHATPGSNAGCPLS